MTRVLEFDFELRDWSMAIPTIDQRDVFKRASEKVLTKLKGVKPVFFLISLKLETIYTG